MGQKKPPTCFNWHFFDEHCPIFPVAFKLLWKLSIHILGPCFFLYIILYEYLRKYKPITLHHIYVKCAFSVGLDFIFKMAKKLLNYFGFKVLYGQIGSSSPL